MTRLHLALSSILVLAIVAVVAALAGRETAPKTSAAVPARSFEFTYQVHVPARQNSAGPTHLWIPLPQADGYQDIRGLHFDSPVSYIQGHDLEYGNAFAAFTPTAQQSAAGFDVVLRFTAVRREHRVALDAAPLQSVSALASRDPNLQRYLEPDKLVPLNGRIAELAREHTAGDTTPIQRLVTSTITCSLPCVMTIPAKAGVAATPSGRALQSVAIAPISILFSLA